MTSLLSFRETVTKPTAIFDFSLGMPHSVERGWRRLARESLCSIATLFIAGLATESRQTSK
jgi:hypothetical protein